MKIRTLVLSAIVSLALFNSPALFADSIHTMAEILMNLNHHPSSSEIDTLKKIANDSGASENERAIATALINLDHKASPADKEKLSKIMNDQSASANERDMAAIIHSLNHKPTSADKDKLHGMM